MRRTLSGSVLIAAMLQVIVAAGGCSTTISTPAAADRTPPDFSLDLTILTGWQASADVHAQQPHVRSSRYIMLADGTLHFGVEPDRGAEWMPPRIRTLDSRQMRELWQVVTDAGFVADASATEPINFKTVTPESDQVAYLLGLTGQGQRWAVIRSTDTMQAEPAMMMLIEHLADLAWVEHHAEARGPLPARYYFGPDPYARYR